MHLCLNPHTNGDGGGKFRLAPLARLLVLSALNSAALPQSIVQLVRNSPCSFSMRTRPARGRRKKLLAGVHNALLDVTAQRLTDVQSLSDDVCRHCPRKI